MKNMKIKAKLIAGFLAIAVLATVLGVFGIVSSSTNKDMITTMYESDVQGLKNALMMQSNLNYLQVLYLEILRGIDDSAAVRSISADVDQLEADFLKAFNEYAATVKEDNPEDARLYETVRKTYFDVFLPIGNAFQSAALAGDAALANELYDDMLESGEGTVTSLDEIVDYNENLCFVAYETSNSLAASTFISTTIILVASIAIAIGLAFYISGLISMPIGKLVDAAEAIAIGDTNIRLDIDSKDEIGELAEAFRHMSEAFNEQAATLLKIAEGDYSGEIAVRSDKDVVNNAIAVMLGNNNRLITEIRTASNQVSAGSQQISQGAQGLASGTTQQAAALQEFSASVQEVQVQSAANTELSIQASDDTRRAGELMSESMSSMHRMTGAMHDINASSQNIAKVIKTIDEIASQTSLLALNASVEAARAGQQGRGFAVVADEVRNLASKSAAAAKDTAALIESSIQKVSEGVTIAETTSESLESVVNISRSNAEMIDRINAASRRQTDAINEITSGMNQIASVVQANSATAQEAAASAEQMSAQAAMLDDIVSRFHLRDSAIAAPQAREGIPARTR